VHPTDRGGWYPSAEYRGQLDARGILCRTSLPGRSRDDAVAERFYDTSRLHSTLGRRASDQHEKMNAAARTVSAFSGEDPTATSARQAAGRTNTIRANTVAELTSIAMIPRK